MAQRCRPVTLTPLPTLSRLPIWLDGVSPYHFVLRVAPESAHGSSFRRHMVRPSLFALGVVMR